MSSSKSIDDDLTNEPNSSPQLFRTRNLSEKDNVFEHNAWDDVIWTEEQEAEAKMKVIDNSKTLIPNDIKEKYEIDANKYWDAFYNIHQNRFFKDRKWLFTEFPDLGSTSDCSNQFSEGKSLAVKIFEVGCGVGNTVFPILEINRNPELFIYCCDLSETAIDIIKENEEYKQGRCSAFVHDISDESADLPFQKETLDIIILIFVLSAIRPDKVQLVLQKLVSYLKPGGKILFRDYGRYDMAQLRFKDGKCLSENFYVRGDGTRVYFFTQDELRNHFTQCGLVEEQNLVDRRLQVNRGKQLKMYRVWILCKYVKPIK